LIAEVTADEVQRPRVPARLACRLRRSWGVVLVLATVADASESSGRVTCTGIVRIEVGVLLVFLSRKYWRRRPWGDEKPELPGWMAAIDSFTSGRAASMGVRPSAANPENALLTIGGAVAIAQHPTRRSRW